MDLAPPPAAAFAGRLLPGEMLLWSGRPTPARKLVLLPHLLIGAFELAMAALLVAGHWSADGWGWRAIGIVLLAFVFHMSTGRVLLDDLRRARLVYAVTNRRVLIRRKGPRPVFADFELGRLPVFELTRYKDGTGSIAFDLFPDDPYFRLRDLSAARPAFERLSDPDRPYRLIRRETEALRDGGRAAPRLISFID